MSTRLLYPRIQANIIKPHTRRFNYFIFCSWNTQYPVKDCRQFVTWMAKEVTSYQVQLDLFEVYKERFPNRDAPQDGVILTMGLSYAAYQLLGLQATAPDDDHFKEGIMGSLFTIRSKYGNNSIQDSFAAFLHDTPQHAIICVAHDNEEKLKETIRAITQASIFRQACKAHFILRTEQKHLTPSATHPRGQTIGPFNYVDGIAKPATEDRLLQTVFGADAHTLAQKPTLGTYMAIQKIICHVSRFERYSRHLRNRINEKRSPSAPPVSLGFAKALLIGRFPKGTPLDLFDKEQTEPEPRNTNQFDYGQTIHPSSYDPEGLRCPLHAHIRSVNPRLDGQIEVPILRRGITYLGRNHLQRWEQALLFVSFQHSISQQLHPLYDKMFNSKHGKQDALTYKKKAGILAQNRYKSAYNQLDSINIDFDKLGGKLTTLLPGFFYYFPAVDFLKSF